MKALILRPLVSEKSRRTNNFCFSPLGSPFIPLLFQMLSVSIGKGAAINKYVVDHFGHPVSNVEVEYYRYVDHAEHEWRRKIVLGTFVSDGKGRIQGVLKGAPGRNSVRVNSEKYVKAGVTESEIRLQRKLVREDIQNLHAASGAELTIALKEVLASVDMKTGRRHVLPQHGNREFSVSEYILYCQKRFRPALRELLVEGEVGSYAAHMLCYIGEDNDIELVKRIWFSGQNAFSNYRPSVRDDQRRLVFHSVIGALIHPKSGEDWQGVDTALSYYFTKPTARLVVAANGSEKALNLAERHGVYVRRNGKGNEVDRISRELFTTGRFQNTDHAVTSIIKAASSGDEDITLALQMISECGTRAWLRFSVAKSDEFGAGGFVLALSKGTLGWRMVGVWATFS